MATYSAKKNEVLRKWYLVNLDNKVLGRAATCIANVLRGKNKPQFTPHIDTGDFVIVVNAEKVRLTGKKLDDKKYHWYSGYPGGLKTLVASELIKKKPEVIIREAVKGMLPKNKLGKDLLGKLKIYSGAAHPHLAQKPEELKV